MNSPEQEFPGTVHIICFFSSSSFFFLDTIGQFFFMVDRLFYIFHDGMTILQCGWLFFSPLFCISQICLFFHPHCCSHLIVFQVKALKFVVKRLMSSENCVYWYFLPAQTNFSMSTLHFLSFSFAVPLALHSSFRTFCSKSKENERFKKEIWHYNPQLNNCDWQLLVWIVKHSMRTHQSKSQVSICFIYAKSICYWIARTTNVGNWYFDHLHNLQRIDMNFTPTHPYMLTYANEKTVIKIQIGQFILGFVMFWRPAFRWHGNNSNRWTSKFAWLHICAALVWSVKGSQVNEFSK